MLSKMPTQWQSQCSVKRGMGLTSGRESGGDEVGDRKTVMSYYLRTQLRMYLYFLVSCCMHWNYYTFNRTAACTH